MTDRHFRQLLRTVVSNAPVVLFAVDAQGTFTLSDGAGLKALGLEPGQVVGQNAFEAYSDYPEICAQLRRALAGEELTATVDVGALAFVTRYTPLRDDAGEITGVIGVSTDITERRRAEISLREGEERLRALYEKTPIMLHSIDLQGRLLSVSDEWCRVLGYEREEILGRPSTEFLTEASRRHAATVILPAFFETGVCTNVPYQLIKSDGDIVDVLLSATAERDAEGKIIRSLAVLVDVTERNRMQTQLMQADRLASLGTLAAGVAHEINNPLSYVITNLDYLLQKATAEDAFPQETALELLRATREGADRVRRIVSDLRVFTRPDLERVERVDVNQVLRSVLQLARSELRHTVRVEVDLGEVPPVAANEARLAQVFLNLVVNAAHAIKAGGPDNLLQISSHATPEGVQVLVQDSGPGIPAELRERIFDPFFTTKPIGKGSGLGLAIGHSIITSLGGSISVDDREGGGTRFTVRIPVGQAETAPPPQRRVTPPPPRKGPRLRVLLIDDDEAVARSLALVLDSFDVTVANSGGEALELCRTQTFDAVLCDVLMPDMVAADVHAGICEIQPELADRTVFMTGAVTPGERTIPDGYPVLQKPFDIGLASNLLHELGPRER